MAIERSNLINISKLVVKELMESSVPFGRMLDSDHVPLQHFFIVLEHALRHGLRPKRVCPRCGFAGASAEESREGRVRSLLGPPYESIPPSVYRVCWDRRRSSGTCCRRWRG